MSVGLILKNMLKNKKPKQKKQKTKKSKNLSPFFFSQNYRLEKFFYSNWKQFPVFKIAKFEIAVQYTRDA